MNQLQKDLEKSIKTEKEIAEELNKEIVKIIPATLTAKKLNELLLNIYSINNTYLRNKLERELKNIYRNEIMLINAKYKTNLTFTQTDKNLFEAVTNHPQLQESLANFDLITRRKISEIVNRGLLENRTPDEIQNKLREVLDIGENRARLIVRTETQKVQSIARFNQYDKLGLDNYKYYWKGPDDRRTTKWCKNITRRTKKGVTIDKLKQIIKEEAQPEFYNPLNPFSPHFQCRHTFYAELK